MRGAYYLPIVLPDPENTAEAIAGILSVMRNTSQPFGLSDPTRPNLSFTRWRTVADWTNMVYDFESTTSPNVIWANLDNLDFSEDAGVHRLDFKENPNRTGDVTGQFEPSETCGLKISN